jgi:hypothetical protein
MAKRIQYCFNCGEDLGIFELWPGDLPTCGKRECEREARYAREAEDAEARERAAYDNYDAYR